MARTEGLLWNQCRMTPSVSELPMASRLMPWWCAIQERTISGRLRQRVFLAEKSADSYIP